ncbi:MAG: thymidylate kinase [Thermoanaerobacteraceae bacterium]|nr:thymidylate kinase [Thermoanaerobacteraceae bacterium]
MLRNLIKEMLSKFHKNDLGVVGMNNVFNDCKKYKGKLFIVEGCDGSGKSTQLYLLKRYLEDKGYPVYYTEWNSSEVVKKATKTAKKKNLLTPTTFCLIHASDFADRYEKQILPHLRAGYIVLADRYIYTAWARDVARGVDLEWVKTIYNFAIKPTAAFYFKAPLEISISRILNGRAQLKFYEAGMDLKLSNDIEESFKIFQGLVKKQYDLMSGREELIVIDATLKIESQQKIMRKYVDEFLKDYKIPDYLRIINEDNVI